MRASRILRATARAVERYLEPGQPTGLTGLLTHRSPRAALVVVYSSTLEKLQQLPESSVYRQSVEALTRHRLAIVDAVKPEGLAAWQESVRAVVAENPGWFEVPGAQVDPGSVDHVERLAIKALPADTVEREAMEKEEAVEEQVDELGEEPPAASEEPNAMELREAVKEQVAKLGPEPQWTIQQIVEVEGKVAAGLIEEVIQVAHGEAKLVDTMINDKVWEDLEEKPGEGQWVYHERDRHTPITQAP